MMNEFENLMGYLDGTDILAGVIGLALGLGIASVLYLRTFTKHLKQLHMDNVKRADDLAYADEHQTRKVEEQNMTALTKRVDEMERNQ